MKKIIVFCLSFFLLNQHSLMAREIEQDGIGRLFQSYENLASSFYDSPLFSDFELVDEKVELFENSVRKSSSYHYQVNSSEDSMEKIGITIISELGNNREEALSGYVSVSVSDEDFDILFKRSGISLVGNGPEEVNLRISELIHHVLSFGIEKHSLYQGYNIDLKRIYKRVYLVITLTLLGGSLILLRNFNRKISGVTFWFFVLTLGLSYVFFDAFDDLDQEIKMFEKDLEIFRNHKPKDSWFKF